METSSSSITAPTNESAEPRRIKLLLGQLNWRMMLVRVLVNGLTLLIVALLLPEISFGDVERPLLNVLFLGAMLGLLNAFVKPVVQFLTLPFIFATYGFVIVAINTIMLLLLAAIFERRFVVDSVVWAIFAGALMGLMASVLESLFGLNIPIFADGGAPGTAQPRMAPGSNPVESLILESISGKDEGRPAEENELGSEAIAEAAAPPAAAAGEGIAPESAPAGETEAISDNTGSATDMSNGEVDAEENTTFPGDEQ